MALFYFGGIVFSVTFFQLLFFQLIQISQSIQYLAGRQEVAGGEDRLGQVVARLSGGRWGQVVARLSGGRQGQVVASLSGGRWGQMGIGSSWPRFVCVCVCVSQYPPPPLLLLTQSPHNNTITIYSNCLFIDVWKSVIKWWKSLYSSYVEIGHKMVEIVTSYSYLKISQFNSITNHHKSGQLDCRNSTVAVRWSSKPEVRSSNLRFGFLLVLC